MLRTVWPVFVQGKWWIWKPLPGLDPGLGEDIKWLAATKWAMCVRQKESRKQLHIKKLNNWRLKLHIVLHIQIIHHYLENIITERNSKK